MNISVIGTGYVGLVTGVCLAEIGNDVMCLDIDSLKINMLNKGKSPIYEEGLEQLLTKNINRGKLHFTTSYEEGLKDREIVYIAVGTPEKKDGSADLSFIESVCSEIAPHLNSQAIIVTKSTVPVGTNEYMKAIIEKEMMPSNSIRIVSNPEFLKQGTAIHDTFNGDRIILGSDDKEALNILAKVNEPFSIQILQTDLRSAEMIKYASNAFLATKISYINEISKLCESVGANIDKVAAGMGLDTRIGKKFLKSGVGYGGSCFPKDTNALISMGTVHGHHMPLLESVQWVNQAQRSRLVKKVMDRFGTLYNKKAAVLGLTFKADTDDMREAPSIHIINELVSSGVQVKAYDPVAIAHAKHLFPPSVFLTENLQEAMKEADFAIILTEWKQITECSLEKYKEYLQEPIIFDGRNCFTLEQAKQYGVEYHSFGRETITSVKNVSYL